MRANQNISTLAIASTSLNHGDQSAGALPEHDLTVGGE